MCNLCLMVILFLISPTAMQDCVTVPSSVGSADSDEIHIKIAENATLFAAPGTAHKVKFDICHRSGVNTSSSVAVSYREELVTTRAFLGSLVRHHTFQIVTALRPEGLIRLEPQSCLGGEVVLNLPDFAQESTKIKIVISVQRRKRPYRSQEKSFYFTVFSGPDLTKVDSSPPVCGNSRLSPGCCPLEEKETEKCNRTHFPSGIWISDPRGSGLRNISVASPGSRLADQNHDFVIGSATGKDFRIWTDCCHRGVEIRAKDVAGNEAVCVVGTNPNSATLYQSHSIYTLLLMSFPHMWSQPL